MGPGSRFACPGRQRNLLIQLSNGRQHSRGAIRPSCASSLSLPLEQRAQGKPGADCARSPVCVGVLQKSTRVNPQVQPRHPGFPRAMVLRLIRALPGERPFLPPLLAGLTADVAPGSRRQDHTISPYAAGVSSGGGPPDASYVPSQPAPRFVTIRENVPHDGAGWAEYSSDLRNSQEIFCNSEMSRHSGARAMRGDSGP